MVRDQAGQRRDEVPWKGHSVGRRVGKGRRAGAGIPRILHLARPREEGHICGAKFESKRRRLPKRA